MVNQLTPLVANIALPPGAIISDELPPSSLNCIVPEPVPSLITI